MLANKIARTPRAKQVLLDLLQITHAMRLWQDTFARFENGYQACQKVIVSLPQAIDQQLSEMIAQQIPMPPEYQETKVNKPRCGNPIGFFCTRLAEPTAH